MYFNKVYSVSTERIISRSPLNNTFDIELQHPQPRRRQISDQNHENDLNKDQQETRIYSIPPDDHSYESEHLPFKNNLQTIPTDLSKVESSPILISSTPEIIEEKHLTFMARSILSGLILILLPIALLSATIFRYTFVSFIYGVLLLIIPWFGTINERNIRTRFRLFILFIGLISLLAIIAQLIFQSILLANKPYGHTLTNCTELTQILRYFGFERLDNSNAIRILRVIFPDIIVFAISTICFLVIRRLLILSRQRQRTDIQPSDSINSSPSSTNTTNAHNRRNFWLRILSIIRRIRLFIQYIILGFTAFIYPSIINSIYFIFFIIIALIWSLSIKFGRKFTIIRALLVIYTGIHLLILYLYQFTFFQDAFQPLSLLSNITGLTAIVRSNCSEREPIFTSNLTWNDYVNPCALLLLYFYFTFETNQTLFHRVRSNLTTIQSVEQQSLVNVNEERNPLEQNSPSLQRQQGLDRTWQERIISIVLSILRVLERQSYLLSLIAMLAWSITYHSLLTLVFLLWACILWILPNSRKWCLRTSPFFTIYGVLLLILQYLCSFKISFDQFNFEYTRQTMKQIGIEINDYQPGFLHLVVKSFYMIFFWLTLRQYITNRGTVNIQPFESRRLDTTIQNSYPQQLKQWTTNFLTKYWIFVSCGTLLFVSIQNNVVIYRIIYMMFYLFFILSFQISFGFWRRTAATFHLTIIIYSMIILIGLYVYQFKEVSDFLSARFSEKLLSSIGLESLKSDVLALTLLTPSVFLIVNIMQLYYFHSDWMELITMPSDKNIGDIGNGSLKEIHAYAKQNTENPDSPYAQQILKSEPKTWQDSLYKFYFRANHLYKKIIYYVWRFGEIHSYKFVLLMMVIVSVFKVSAFNVSLIILTTIGLTLFRLRPLINLLTLIITGLYIIASMCYQLEIAKQLIIEQNILVKNCSENILNVTINENINKIPNDTAKWFGLELTSRIDQFIGLYIILTLVLTFDSIIRYRQRHRRLKLSVHFNVRVLENRYPILFEPFTLKNFNTETYQYDIVNYQHADENIANFIKYLANFLFYRFGLEICYITIVTVIAIHLDVFAVIYAVWLGIFLISSRKTIKRIWPFYIFFLIIVFPLQYMSAVGAPPFLCFDYPWTNVSRIDGWPQLKHWLYLPDYVDPPLATTLIADFILFLFSCQQWRLFVYEFNEKDQIFIESGGSNREIIYDDDMYKNNPTWDFITYKRNWLDRIKHGIFMYGAWIVLSIVYLAGTTRISLLGLGYLIACFYFLWYGQDFFTKRITVMVRLWNYLIYYCFAVVFLKACLQVVVCIFLYPKPPCTVTSTFCTIVDLFVPCLKSNLKPIDNCYASFKTTSEQCERNAADASLFMDGFCMAFLLLQKRIFGSYYWEHVAVEFRSRAKLASRGAILFNEITRKRNEEDRLHEEEIVSKITRSLQRIKEQQQKLNQSKKTGTITSTESKEHFEAIRSGDYYMYEYDSDEKEEDIDEEKTDETTIAQEQIFHILTESDRDVQVAVSSQKPGVSSMIDSNVQPITTELSTIPKDLQATTEPVSTSVNEQEESKKSRRTAILARIRLIVYVVIDYVTDLLNRNSRDHREVSIQLAEIKSKDKILQRERMRLESSGASNLTVNIDSMINDDRFNQFNNRQISKPVDLSERSRLYRLFDSLFYFTMSRSGLICYSAMIINHLTSGTLLSMPLPLSIFLWATLSIRPSRNYWITVLTYTEAMIVVKYIFQFRFYPWNGGTADSRPLAAINIIGIDRKETATSFVDLFLLLSLFLHRSILKQLGLWKSARTTPTDSPVTTTTTTTTSTTDTTEQQQDVNNPIEGNRIISNSYFMKPIIRFYRQLQQAPFIRDVYAPMFFCDFINMGLVIAYYSQFGERSGGNVVQTIRENRVPVAFLVILLIQFALIIIDRALYLRRNIRGKLFFQLFQIILVHIWLFFVLPGITRTKFRDNTPAQFWYIFKCIYFGYSSIQVRYGYPKRLAGNFLMRRFNYFNQILYRIYLLIPFLLELRTIMDWMFTDTSLGLTSWLQLEDVYSNIYLLKCSRWAEDKYPTERGKPRPKLSKYGIGGSLLAILILLIWFPLLFFSFTSSFYQPNPPKEVTVDIKLGGYLPIYQMTAQDSDLISFSDADYNSLRTSIYSPNIDATVEDSAYAFLRDFNPNDITCVNLFSTSVNIWEISQPIRDIVINNLQTNVTVPVRFSYTIIRNPPNEDDSEDIAAVVTGEHMVNIEVEHRDIRNALVEILNGTIENRTTTTFTINKLIPRFLHVKPKAKPEEINPFMSVFKYGYYANITMGLNRTREIPNSTEVWWKMSESRTGSQFIPSCFQSREDYLGMMFFNDKISPANISFLTRYGIIGLYTTFVIVVARLLRTILQTSQTIMFNELPCVERIWHLLRDIYLVRAHNYLLIEEELFGKLIFLYRSPETLMTKMEKHDWKGYTLILPSICHCYVGQLAVDILINTFAMKNVRTLDWLCVEPVIAYNPYENGDRENLAFGIEVYEESDMKLLVIQQRGNIVSGKRQEFVDQLLAFSKNEQLKEIIVLTAFNAVERNDVQLSGDQFRYLSTISNSNDLGWIALEERQDKHHHKIVRDRDRYYIAGGGIANRLFYTFRQQTQIPVTVLLMFTDVGHEVQHANELLTRLNQWKKFRQVEQWQMPASQRAWIETQTVPPIY